MDLWVSRERGWKSWVDIIMRLRPLQVHQFRQVIMGIVTVVVEN